jgi:hypothetical protein
MPADSDYSEILERLADGHQERLSNALKTLENNVASIMDNAPIKDGKLFDLEWAVNARPELRAALEADYLSEVDSIVRDYAGVSADASKMLSTYGDFAKLDSAVISQLQGLSFQGFQAVANEYLDVLANEVYQSTLTGRAFNDTVKNLRQTINGVYIQSDSVEANRLVDIAANGTKAQQADAVRQLQTIYARDRVGNNLRRYATQMAQDSLMQFDASVNTAIGKQTGATKWKYYGTTIRDTRPFCREHVNQVFTTEEIEETWAGSWKGKASGDPYIVRGGYNCRHHWRPVFDEEPEIEEETATVTDEPNSQETDVVNEVEFVSISKAGEKEITVSDFNTALNAITPIQMALVQRLPKPKKLVGKTEGGLYDSYNATLTSGIERGGSIVRHEYGHHVDYMLKKELGGFGALSENDFKFKKAFEKDRIALGLKSSKTKQAAMDDLIDEMYDTKVVEKGRFTYTKRIIKNDELTNLSDIVDALTHGQLQKKYRVWGHGVSYYKQVGSRYKEAFANLFALRHTPQWEIVEKRFPEMAARFDEIMEGKI